jgi:hypothetical protein
MDWLGLKRPRCQSVQLDKNKLIGYSKVLKN